VRHLRKEPREDDQKEVESRRLALISQFSVLDTLHGSIASALNLPASVIDTEANDDAAVFDDLDDEEPHDNILPQQTPGGQAAAAGDDVPLPEQRFIALPSNSGPRHVAHRAEELKLRITQAEKCLQALRDAIADKSFQYSHVIRVAARKSVNTRARATIARLNNKITYHARVYCRCRKAMAALDAGDAMLQKYQILLKEHLRSSAALLNPNEPGSTQVQLSWIWKTADGGPHQTPDALRECELSMFVSPLSGN
jgi:hypothetical protein